MRPIRLLLVAVLLTAENIAAWAGNVDLPLARQAELTRLVRQDCGSCHGMRLTGGLGLPLTAEALRDKPAESLVATVMQGRPSTAMPPWRTIISEADATWIVGQLLGGFPEDAR